MFIKLTKAWISTQTGEYVYVEVNGDKGIETREGHFDSHMQYQITYFDTALKAFRAMEHWHEDPAYTEVC